MNLERASSELSLFNSPEFNNPGFRSLGFWGWEYRHDDSIPGDDAGLKLVHDVIFKSLHRGDLTFPSYDVEAAIVGMYGEPFAIKEKDSGSISYASSPELIRAYNGFRSFTDARISSIEAMTFDPQNPANEKRLFEGLVKRFGKAISGYTHTQAPLENLLPQPQARDFRAQRLDFLIDLPNGRSLIIEPGDHDDAIQQKVDAERDKVFSQQGIRTLRPRNSDISDESTYRTIAEELEKIGAGEYMADATERDESTACASHLFLLPSLVARMERVLLFHMIRRGMILRDHITIGVVERDLNAAEISLVSFLDKVERVSELYSVGVKAPAITLKVDRRKEWTCGSAAPLTERLKRFRITVEMTDEAGAADADLVMDVAAVTGIAVPPVASPSQNFSAIRNAYRHNREVSFSYPSTPGRVAEKDGTEKLLETFLRDFFRKRQFRQGQYPILRNVLAQKNTIGLLPTSGGKSICYQLASLLTPGTTIVVDPIKALMDDQVASLRDTYRITRVVAWYAGVGLKDEEAGRILTDNLIVFMSPERFLRPTFRGAMQGLPAADLYVNYAVVDEAHCVSMWGHDFRPAYLSLEKNFRRFCTFQGREPVVVALTGTASQLVLIDLKRELGIQDMEAIIRPKTFDRPELHFSVVAAPSKQKEIVLNNILRTIAGRLNVNDPLTGAWGVIFAYTRPQIWRLFGSFVGNAGEYIRAALAGGDLSKLKYGMYCGKQPKESPLSGAQWDEYKALTLKAFKGGAMRLLIGNTAVGVGLDNERLNYVVNYCMPQSLEAYYQQCGRAGRSGQRSECLLIYSDDDPAQTEKWLDDDKRAMPTRWDDIGTVSYFHASNFPGEEQEFGGVQNVLAQFFSSGNLDKDGWATVRPITALSGVYREDADPTEKYIAYLLMLGIISDYEVQGMGQRTIFRLVVSSATEKYMQDKDLPSFKEAVVRSLCDYLTRYRPIRKSDVEKEIESGDGERFSDKVVRYLIAFIYREIAYQRREAIRTMRDYCTDADTSPERWRGILRAYFDRTKFSDLLDGMADTAPDFAVVEQVLRMTETYDDVESLFWETRRRLDERYRPDWSAINTYSMLYRERDASERSVRAFEEMVVSLRGDPQMNPESTNLFLVRFLKSIQDIDQKQEDGCGPRIYAKMFGLLYEKYGLQYLRMIEELPLDDKAMKALHMTVTIKQLDKLLYESRFTRGAGRVFK